MPRLAVRTSSTACCGSGAVLQQRMLDLQAAVGQIRHQLRDPLRIGRGRRGAVHGLLEARIGDQFHRPRDLADVANRCASFVEGAGFGHGIPVVRLRGHRFAGGRFVTRIEVLDRRRELGGDRRRSCPWRCVSSSTISCRRSCMNLRNAASHVRDVLDRHVVQVARGSPRRCS